MIAVNRHLPGPGGKLPARDKTTVATIGGYTLLPMRPVNARPQYNPSGVGYVNRAVVTSGGGVLAGGQVRGASSPGGVRPVAPSGARPAAPRSASPSHAAPAAPASHVSSGGGGGAPHAASGGGHH
jgi:hypothetical protein